MEELETFWRFTVTSLAVWRLSRLLIEKEGGDVRQDVPGIATEDPAGIRFWAGRAVDLSCWISVWMSSQTAIWVTCGLAGVFLSWVAASGVSRLLLREAETLKAEAACLAGPRLSCPDEMQVRNG